MLDVISPTILFRDNCTFLDFLDQMGKNRQNQKYSEPDLVPVITCVVACMSQMIYVRYNKLIF